MHFPTRYSLASPGHGILHAARQFVDNKVADTWIVTEELGRLGACAREEAPRDERTRSRVATALVEQVLVDFESSASAAGPAHADEGISLLQAHCAAKGTRITARHVKLLGAAVQQADGDIRQFPGAVRTALMGEPVLPVLARKTPATPQRSGATPRATSSTTSTSSRTQPAASQRGASAGATRAAAKPVRTVRVPARDPNQRGLLERLRRERAEAAQAASLAEGKAQ